jgi:hypothetical protein
LAGESNLLNVKNLLATGHKDLARRAIPLHAQEKSRSFGLRIKIVERQYKDLLATGHEDLVRRARPLHCTRKIQSG